MLVFHKFGVDLDVYACRQTLWICLRMYSPPFFKTSAVIEWSGPGDLLLCSDSMASSTSAYVMSSVRIGRSEVAGSGRVSAVAEAI